MTFFNVSSRCVKYHRSLDSSMLVHLNSFIAEKEVNTGTLNLNCFSTTSLKCSSGGGGVFYQTVELEDFRDHWGVMGEDGLMYPRSSLLNDRSSFLSAQIRDLGRSLRWHHQNNLRFKRGARSKETINKRLETQPLCNMKSVQAVAVQIAAGCEKLQWSCCGKLEQSQLWKKPTWSHQLTSQSDSGSVHITAFYTNTPRNTARLKTHITWPFNVCETHSTCWFKKWFPFCL